jgi:hypothetical protein
MRGYPTAPGRGPGAWHRRADRAVAHRKLTQLDAFLRSSLPVLRSFGQAVATYLEHDVPASP